MLKVEFPTEEFDTVSGFLISEIGYIPSEEENPVITYKNMTFEVKKIVENRIENVIVTIRDNDNKDNILAVE
ncbi:hypothetical protein MUB24_05990 [Lederbergia sp. NSJ-179]|nr:hypothetical protein [Lederbergia sp. NSJ-179]